MKRILPIYIVLALFASGCSKSKLPNSLVTPSPLFLNVDLNGETVNFGVGINNMSSEATSEFDASANIRNFTYMVFDINDTTGKFFGINLLSNIIPSGNDGLNELRATVHNGTYKFTDANLSFSGQPGTVAMATSKNNQYYSTEFCDQSNSSFEVSALEELVNDGKTYIKVSVMFNCLMVNEDKNDTIRVTNGFGNIAFSNFEHP